MKKTKLWLRLFIFCFAWGWVIAPLIAQTTIPEEQIPADAPKAVVKKIRALYSADARVRLFAVIDLMKMKQKAVAAVPFLVGILGDNEAVEVEFGNSGHSVMATGRPGDSAVKALVAIGAASFEPTLAALENKEKLIRIRAIEAIGDLRDRRAVKKLVDMLREDDAEIRKAVVTALETITGEKKGEDPTNWEPFIK